MKNTFPNFRLVQWYTMALFSQIFSNFFLKFFYSQSALLTISIPAKLNFIICSFFAKWIEKQMSKCIPYCFTLLLKKLLLLKPWKNSLKKNYFAIFLSFFSFFHFIFSRLMNLKWLELSAFLTFFFFFFFIFICFFTFLYTM